MVWKDCFGRVLKQGEDVILSNDSMLRSGIVIELNDDNVLISYNFWIGEQECVEDMRLWDFEYPDGIISRVYKIFN